MSFELGVNYWPRRTGMYMWREFDLPEIRDEMAHISDLGFDVVRVFTLAEDFMPRPMTVATGMVERLVHVVGAAKDARLMVVPTLIVLNMSGRIWWPEWMLGPGGEPGDLFSDPVILGSQALLVETCARALAGDEAIRAFDVSNEIDGAQMPRSRDAARSWASTMTSTIRQAAPGTPIQIGTHLPSLTTADNMRVDDLATVTDEDVMHAYPLYSEHARSSLDPDLVPFSCALTSGLTGGRPTLMQEFGLCTSPRGSRGETILDDFLGDPCEQYLASEEEAFAYYETVLDGLATTGAAGAYAWCFADYDSRLFDRPPFATAVRERTFGLLRSDGSEKPAAGVFSSFRKRRDDGIVPASAIPSVLDMSADEYYQAPAAHFARLYARWVDSATS